jgi:hypothetical protein
MLTAEQIIEHYCLEPLDQEGGYFRQVWKSDRVVSNTLLGAGYPKEGGHPMGTLIHFLLTADSFSAMHRLPTPEHWFYQMGDPGEMLLLHADGRSELIELGPDFSQGQRIQYSTPAQSWQGTRLRAGGVHGYFFGSCVMVPGFEWTDFELGARKDLVEAFPEQQNAIELRTRTERFDGAL